MPNRSLTIAQVLTYLQNSRMLCFGACISIVSFVPAYFAWKLPPKDIVE